ARVRGWTVMPSTPSASASRAISGALTVRSSHPPRILIVNAPRTAFRIVRKTTAARRGSRLTAAPWPFLPTFAPGQPMLLAARSAGRETSCSHHRTPASVDHRDRADRRAVGALDLQRQREEPAARRADLVQVREVFDDGDAGREEMRVRRVLVAPRRPAARRR